MAAKRAKKTARRRSIEDDTPIIPWIVADTIVRRDAPSLLDEPAQHRKVVAYLTKYAEAVYRANDDFAKKIRASGNKGRDTLYVFMEHWFASWLKKNESAIFRALPPGYGWSYSPSLRGRR